MMRVYLPEPAIINWPEFTYGEERKVYVQIKAYDFDSRTPFNPRVRFMVIAEQPYYLRLTGYRFLTKQAWMKSMAGTYTTYVNLSDLITTVKTQLRKQAEANREKSAAWGFLACRLNPHRDHEMEAAIRWIWRELNEGSH